MKVLIAVALAALLVLSIAVLIGWKLGLIRFYSYTMR